ncbi:MAG: molybdate ABC transporter permease subunit [Deltaproteobacteria bacterium]|nr:molybdate ABC transporter permease subunit [Deltaproteobacteria bacterium]MCW5801871.1 molybdate ABC transporter permease subunit [Deltaproteobacteria bacterium]
MTWAPLWLSFEIAALATVLTVVVGTALAVLLDWKRLPGRDFLDALVSAPLVLPPTVLGYYLLVVLGNKGAIGRAWESVFGSTIVFNYPGAVIAAAVGSLPLVVRAVRVALEGIDPNLIFAARTLGARPVRVLFRVTLPLAAPGIVAGAMLGFARALGDYGATQMVAGSRLDGTSTASIYVMDQLLANNDDSVFAMSAAMTAFGVAMLYLANRLTRRNRRG